ncbi:MAG: extracellular solute-binding protein [Dorea sp.]
MNHIRVMKKRLLSILLCSAMVASLAVGCGSSGGSDTEEAEESSGEKTTLTFWCHENEPWIKSYEAMAEKFEAENPEYDVVVESYPMSVYMDKIQTALTDENGGPDIIALWGGMAAPFIASDALSAVPDDLAADMDEDFMEPTVGIYKKNGTYYGVPMEYNLEYGGMVVNKKLFEEAGLEYPQTWEELRAVSKQVAKVNGDVVEMGGFECIDGDALINNFLAMILQQGGNYIEEDGSVNFATEEGITALNELLSIVKDGECTLENLSAGEYCFNDVYQDKAFMSSVGTWAIGEGTDSYELTYGEDFEYVAVPQYGDEMAFTSESGWGLIVPANGANVDAAWDYVRFFTDPENLVEHNIACNQLPPRTSMLDSEEYREAMSNIDFILDILPYGKWRGSYSASAMNSLFDQMFIDLCQSENPDVEASLAEVSQKITEECSLGYTQD